MSDPSHIQKSVALSPERDLSHLEPQTLRFASAI